jgi:hypothetical protein
MSQLLPYIALRPAQWQHDCMTSNHSTLLVMPYTISHNSPFHGLLKPPLSVNVPLGSTYWPTTTGVSNLAGSQEKTSLIDTAETVVPGVNGIRCQLQLANINDVISQLLPRAAPRIPSTRFAPRIPSTRLHCIVLGGHTCHKTMKFMSRMVRWCACTSKT